ncbi:MAG: AraC family transcriptional regulator [Ferruginibacter sp.]|nr:AraC family transcriptional regulator [Chitinophagaceae bacterium]
MSAQPIIFFLLFGGVQGLLLFLFFIRKKLYRRGYIFLLLYFGVMLLQITLKLMSKSWLWENWYVLYGMTYQMPLLYGPLIFLFVRQSLLNKKRSSKDLFHFFPFALMASFLLLEGLMHFSNRQVNFFYGKENQLALQLISLAGYHALALRGWLQHRHSLKTYYSEMQRLQANWIRQFIIVSFIACSIVALSIYFLYIRYPLGAEFRYGFAVLTLFIYWVSYTALSQPAVFAVVKGYDRQDSVIPVIPKLIIHRQPKKYSNSSLKYGDLVLIKTTLQQLMADKKPYLRPDLTISDLAVMVNCTRHHLSQLLNDTFRRSFYDFINLYRVEEAKQLLLEPARDNHKIASIAYDSGFNSLSTFNEVFRKMTGQTPSQFRRQGGEDASRQRV